MIKTIEIARIDVRDRQRLVDPAWAGLMAETVRDGAILPPIDVLDEDGGRYRLITGAHRLAALASLGRTEVEARIWSRDAFRSEAEITLREIQENAIRAEYNELDRAVAMATWQQIYEDLHPVRKVGRPKRASADNSADAAPIFAERFSATAARLLGLSERSIHVYVQIARGIGPAVRAKLVGRPITRQQSELILLARESQDRQMRILSILHAEPPAATSVADAIALLDRTTPPQKQPGWVQVSERVARLAEGERFSLFDALAEDIDRWRVARGR